MQGQTIQTNGVDMSIKNLNKAVIQRQTIIDINLAVDLCHGLAKDAGWWGDLETGEPIERNKGELMMLMVSEIAEMMEGVRKDLPDEKLPHRTAEEVELADAVIRMFDYAGAYNLDLGSAIVEKLIYNSKRADHKPKNRALGNGKKF
jgi:hypothetical protein